MFRLLWAIIRHKLQELLFFFSFCLTVFLSYCIGDPFCITNQNYCLYGVRCPLLFVFGGGGRMLNALENYHIYKGTVAGNQINYKQTSKSKKIYETVLKHDKKWQHSTSKTDTPINRSVVWNLPPRQEGGYTTKGRRPNPLIRETNIPTEICK